MVCPKSSVAWAAASITFSANGENTDGRSFLSLSSMLRSSSQMRKAFS